MVDQVDILGLPVGLKLTKTSSNVRRFISSGRYRVSQSQDFKTLRPKPAIRYSPENSHNHWKMMIVRVLSFGDDPF